MVWRPKMPPIFFTHITPTGNLSRVYPGIEFVNIEVYRLEGRTAGRVFGTSERLFLCRLNLE